MKLGFFTNQYSQQRQREKPVWVYPVLMAMQAQYYRNQGHDVYWNTEGTYDRVVTEPENLDFLSLPAPDRIFSGAFDKRYQLYGNYKFHPATHMQVADGCWHGKCVFCVERGKEYQVRSIDDVIYEIEVCRRMGFKEIFDDSGTFPDGTWLEVFCHKKWGDSRLNNIVMGCNMRINSDVDFNLMKQANFRMLLFGIESANQLTLDRLNKGVNANDIIPVLKKASDAGLEPHGAFMFGYPWESEKDEVKTLDLVHFLLRKGYLKTAQASVYDTPQEKGRRTGIEKKIYDVGFYPDFWFHQLSEIRNMADFLYFTKKIKKGIIHD